MKKVFILLLVLMVAFTVNVKADSIRAGALSADITAKSRPTALLKDTSVLGTYPGALQLFPNSVWLTVPSVTTEPTFGVAYIANNFVGVATKYSTSPDTDAIKAPWTIPSITNPTRITNSQHVWFIYGVKLGALAAGLMIQDTFPTSQILSQTIDSNGNVSDEESQSGFKMMIKPSAVFDMGAMKIYGAVFTTLDLTKYNQFNSYQSNELTIDPTLMESIGVDATVSFDISKSFTAAVMASFTRTDDGYSATLKTNGNTAYSGTNYLDSKTSIDVIFGTLIKASEVVTLFFDVPFGINFGDAARWDGKATYTKTSTWTLPVLKAGAEVALGKGFTFRASAAPLWKRSIIKPVATKTSQTVTSTDTYSISSALGLGYHTGRLYINSIIKATSFSIDSLKPLTMIGGLFTGAAQQYFTSVQFNWVW